jgi:4-amino-4-deoxy-L-arabinose transferase-like glycosyltransferase
MPAHKTQIRNAPGDRAAKASCASADVAKFAKVEAFLAAHRWYVIAAIVTVSMLLRIVYFAELNHDACLYQHRWVDADMNFNDLWAKDIVAGDVLTDKPLHPLHWWHKNVATEYFALHPEKSQELLSAWNGPGPVPSAEKLLWDHWYGGKVFHQEPLYPYLLALTYKLFGDDVRPMFILQMLIGVLGNVLVYLIARKYFGDLVGTIAGVFATACGPLLYYEMILLRESMLGVVGLLLIFLIQRVRDKSTWSRWAILGAVCGTAILLKTSLAPFVVMALGILAWNGRKAPRELLPRLGAAVAGVLLAMSPAIARNIYAGAPAFGLSSVGAVTFVCANAQDYADDSEPFTGEFFPSKYTAQIMGDSDGKFLPAVGAALRTHPDVASYVRQLWRKFDLLCQWHEVPNNSNFYYYRIHAGVLRALPVTFFLLGPLALAGIAIALPRWRQCWPLLILLASMLPVLLAFGVLSRLRIPAVGPLIPLAALTVGVALQWVWTRNAVRLAILIGCLAVLFLWMGRPLPQEVPLIRNWDYAFPYKTYYDPNVQEAYARDDPSGAAAWLADSLQYEPAFVGELDSAHPAVSIYYGDVAAFFRSIRRQYADALRRCAAVQSEPQLKDQLDRQARRQDSEVIRIGSGIPKWMWDQGHPASHGPEK